MKKATRPMGRQTARVLQSPLALYLRRAISVFWVAVCCTLPAQAADEPAPSYELATAYTAEWFRNASGGLATGSRYMDNVDLTLAVDGAQAFGWDGTKFFAYALYNNGRTFNDDLVGSTQGISNIEAVDASICLNSGAKNNGVKRGRRCVSAFTT
jgi:hypothetical protein